MIDGAHAIIYSTDAEADRAFLRDVLGLPSADAGGGWLIFGLPPSEVAVHPSDENDRHELYFLCDDVDGLVRTLGRKGIPCSPVHEERWGRITQVSLPGGGRIGIYEPKHPRAPHARSGRSERGKRLAGKGAAKKGTSSRRAR